jgi:hypothetical protein
MNALVPPRLNWFARIRSSRPAQIAAAGWRWIQAVIGWVPFSFPGLIALPALVASLYFLGVKRHDSVVLGMTACGLFLAAAGVVVVTLTAIAVRVLLIATPSVETLRLESGVPTRTGLSLGWLHWNPLVTIDVRWDHPLDVEIRAVSRGGRLVEEATAHGRAWSDAIVRRVRVADVLGLSRVTFRVKHRQAVRALPSRGRAETIDILAQHKPGEGLGHPDGMPEGDLIDARKYGPGDPLKLVLWKVYARAGRMLVRTPERAVAPCDKILAYFVAGPGDERSAELARAALDLGRLGNDYLFAADGDSTTTSTAADAVEAIARSVNARSYGGDGFASFLNQGTSRQVRSCVIFAPARRGAWVEAVVAGIRGFDGRAAVLIGVDESHLTAPASRMRRWLLSNAAADGSLAEMHEITATLTAAGARVSVLHAGTGERIPATTNG